jgi:hypothetical protein
LGNAAEKVSFPKKGFYAAVGTCSSNTEITVNFGAKPFKFDVLSFYEEIQRKQEKTLKRSGSIGKTEIMDLESKGKPKKKGAKEKEKKDKKKKKGTNEDSLSTAWKITDRVTVVNVNFTKSAAADQPTIVNQVLR